jgi:hypothetical protein
MRRNLFDDIVETNSDLSRTRAGKTERGGSEGLVAVLACACAWSVEVNRNAIEAFTLLVGRVHRARAVRGFPGSKVPISLK